MYKKGPRSNNVSCAQFSLKDGRENGISGTLKWNKNINGECTNSIELKSKYNIKWANKKISWAKNIYPWLRQCRDLYVFPIAPSALVLFGLEILPLVLHLVVLLQFRVALGVDEAELLVNGNEVGA